MWPLFACFVKLDTRLRTDEQDIFRALRMYLLPEMLPLGTPARMRQEAPVITSVHWVRAGAVVASAAAACIGRACTLATETSAAEQASANMLMCRRRPVVGLCMVSPFRCPPGRLPRRLLRVSVVHVSLRR